MGKHSHLFVENYSGIGALGWDRKTDEETLKFYLQKFSDDQLMELLIPKLSDGDIEAIYGLINSMLKKHLTESDYHRHFLKDGTH
ncbi:MAG: cytoplasmic protein [Proteobacteria bacterium]|nr:cytoplasmic protein [Pseudomonadota bacterium]